MKRFLKMTAIWGIYYIRGMGGGCWQGWFDWINISFSIKKSKNFFWSNVKSPIFAIPKTNKLYAEAFLRGKDR
jgi:hypothetical protein